jgi:hypothetical protein
VDSDEHDDYRWQPADGDWEQLTILANEAAKWPHAEFPALIERTFEGLGFAKAEADALAVSEAGQHKFAAEAAERIRDGSKRLGKALIDSDQEQLRRIISSEPVLFYRELAQTQLDALLEGDD